MRALRRFTVRATLPPELTALSDLVMNLRWSWNQDTLDLFASVDPELWRECGGDPVRMLGAISPGRLSALSRDKRFIRRLSDAADDLNDYLSQPRWYQDLVGVPRSVAYFSMEFGLTEVLPQYSGGLGILAGDHLKAASDLGVPIIGVGLLYRAGYFAQGLSRDGWQQELYPSIDPHGLPLVLLRDGTDAPVKVQVAMPDGGRTLRAQVWKAQVGRVPLLLLDSDIEDNEAADRQVTDKLYGGAQEHRMAQEVLAGVGGVRAVRAYCELTGTPAPEVFHTNEGHAGFLGLERMRELVAQGLTFDEALAAVRAGTVFTTHTPVPAGIDRFTRELVRSYFEQPEWAALPVERVLDLGAETDPGLFNMAHMGLRLAQRANGVSKLHGEVSRGMFRPLWPGFDTEEVPITSVTNGVHAPTWMSREVTEIAEREVPYDRLQEGEGWEAVDKVPDEDIWGVRRVLRERLIDEVRRRVHASQLQRGLAEAELGWTADVFDPDVLTIGFAR
ncbi:MAG TPA: alpha-glucan family phosphorylase, partial [Mycobacteriales bacterium]|nr:alpha-glucan family phosphorylase [Mycobacteriales bacterium]